MLEPMNLEVPGAPTPVAGGDPAWVVAASEVGDQLDADVLFYNGRIARPHDRALIETLRKRARRANVFFVIVTAGGDPDAAYRIARSLQESYDKVTIYVPGYCKSAGALICVGGNELVIDDHGELGPLDMQMMKTDELWETNSGLTVMEALNVLENIAYRMLEDGFLRIKEGSGGQITFRTATEVAVQIVSGTLEPIYKQIDPMHVGEAGRAMNVARDYGSRLAEISKNVISNDALENLISLFSSHGFVIDRREAATYFKNVRPPAPYEAALAEHLQDLSREPRGADVVWTFLTEESNTEALDDEGGDHGADNAGEADAGSTGEGGQPQGNGSEASQPVGP